MRPVVIWLLLAIAAAEVADEPWVEEEDVDESYDDYEPARARRDVHDAGPFDEHVRVKRCCEPRARRSAEYVRVPRQLHQYEVHEFTDDSEMASPPYEEMLAASANHYHKVYAPSPRYLRPDVASANVAQAVKFTPSDAVNAPPVQFVASPPAAVPLASNPIPVDNPVPVASEPLIQAPKQLASGDLYGAPTGHHSKHAHGRTQGGGHAKHGAHHGQHGAKTSKGFNQHHYVDKGGKGFKTDEHHKKQYEEAAGKKKKHHDHAGHKGSHEEEAFGQRGAKFDEKKGHKKGHKTKGYHNKYHKDEFHKEHKFYDDFHKSGEHHRYGKFNAKHASNESGKKKAHHVNAGHDFVEKGKKGYSNKGHVDADHKGYHGKQGHEHHNEKHEEHGKKGGKATASQWGYKKN
ncbi:unnamed protein product [Chrysodeixis includens]|uniref:Histidine-rich glycoprotein-like n=1 Tax=Chrysodeixis includens TaxID=689277 RepID=A0A9P0G124_CHRIL|nr:unnamed protein product [Chrysodeixis includens]